MAEQPLSAPHKRGAKRIFVVSRTRENARRLGERYGARHMPFDQLPKAIAATDIIITSTSAPHHVITCDMVAARRLFGLQL
jgi:glutamyl-tRNA reductase